VDIGIGNSFIKDVSKTFRRQKLGRNLFHSTSMPKSKNNSHALYSDILVLNHFNKKLPKLPLLVERTEAQKEAIDFYISHKDFVRKLMIDKSGNYIIFGKRNMKEIDHGINYIERVYTGFGDAKTMHFNDIFKPFNSPVGTLVHRTDNDSYNKIMKDGFKVNPLRHNDTFEGIYFSPKKDNPIITFGDKNVNCLFHGKVATGNSLDVRDLVYSDNPITKYFFKKSGQKNLNSFDSCVADFVTKEFVKDELLKRGYTAYITSDVSAFAQCKYFVTWDIPNLEIIK
jgi:hypothetical protein